MAGCNGIIEGVTLTRLKGNTPSVRSSIILISLSLLFLFITGISACKNRGSNERKDIKDEANSPLPMQGYFQEESLGDSTVHNTFLESRHLAIPPNAINVKSHGATGDGRTDDVKAINKAIAEANKYNAPVYFPKGIYAIGKPGIRLAFSDIHLVGSSRDEVVIRPISKVNALVTSIHSDKNIKNITLENITFQCEGATGSSAFAILLFGGLSHIRIDGCRFKDIYRTFIRMNDVNDATLSNSLYTNAGEIRNGVFVLVRNCSNINFRNNNLLGYYNGFYVYPQPPNEKAEDIVVEGNTFDGRWYLSQERLSGEGSEVSFTANSVRDSKSNFLDYAADFSRRVTARTVAEWRLVRVLSTRGNGTAQFEDKMVIDPDAHFKQWGVIPGEIIEVGENRGVIREILSDTELTIEYWYNKHEVEIVPSPSGQLEYKVFSLYLGRITGFAAHTVQVTEWHDLNGRILTPPNGARYEVVKQLPLYGLYFTKDVRNVTIANNRLLRNYADQIGWQGSKAVIKNNYIKDGQDVGITVSNKNLSGSIITGNHVQRQGSCGIFINGNNNEVANNIIIGPIPTVNLYNDSTLAGIQVMGGTDNLVYKNRIDLRNALNGYGITLSSKVRNLNKVENNIIENVENERKLNLFEDTGNLRNKWQFEPDKSEE